MAEKVLKIKTVSDVAEAIAGLTDLQGSLKGVGTAAFEAAGKSKAQWKELEATWKSSSAAANGLAAQAFKAESALNAMGRATGAGQLEKSLVAAQIEVSRLSDKMLAAAAAGATLDDGATASLTAMRVAVAAGQAKLEDLRTSTERARKELGLLGDEGKRAGASMAGVSSGTERLGDSMRKSSEGVAKFRGAALELFGVLSTGKMIGEALASAIDSISARMAAQDKAANDAAVRAIKFEQAIRLVERGEIDLGRTTEDMIRNYDAYVAKMREAAAANSDEAKAARQKAQDLKDLGEIIESLRKATSFEGLASPEERLGLMPLDEAAKYAERLNELLGKAFKDGGAGEREAWFNANKETIDKVVAAYEHFGIAVPDQIKAAYDKILADKGAQRVAEETMKWLAEESAAWEKRAADVARARAAEDAANNRTSRAPAEFKQIQDAAFGAAVAAGELGTNLDRVAEAVVATGGQMVVGAPIMIQYAAATKEAKEELLGFLEAQRALREEQARALEGAQGWLSILSNLKDSYESGETSLYNYITQLQQLDTQVRQLFGGATGDAKTAVDALTDAIAKLISTAVGSGPGNYTPGVAGQLERQFRRKKGK